MEKSKTIINTTNQSDESPFEISQSIVDDLVVETFTDQNGAAYALFDNPPRNIDILSKDFDYSWILLHCKCTDRMPTKKTRADIRDHYISRAQSSPKRTLSLRYARQGDSIFCDLGRDDWQCVRIDPTGWQIVQLEQPPFKRTPLMGEMPLPTKGGSVFDIFDVIHVDSSRERNLIAVWLVSVMIPDIARPGLIFNGSPGGGKSWTLNRLRDVIDPSGPASGLPRDIQSLIQKLDQNYLPCFDHLQKLHVWASDELCRAVSGTKETVRRLYTKSDIITFEYQRTFILAGVSFVAAAGDLLDRALTVTLSRLTDEQRMGESTLKAQFEEIRPGVLGAAFTALSQALATSGKDYYDRTPRLSDWWEIAVPIADALGIFDEFCEAYRHNKQAIDR